MKTKILTTLFGLLFIAIAHGQSVQKQIKALDSYIENAIKVWQPPGLAVAVIKDGKVIFSKGYGINSVEQKKAVDTHTLFAVGSTTKAFISASLAMLVDEGKVEWDDHVIDYLPNFQLYDPYVTRELTIRDLLTHRSGVGNTDYLWSLMNISGDSALYKMREVEPSYSLRSSFVYQNLFYLAAGMVVEQVSGKQWGEFLRDRIFNPLEMNESYPVFSQVKSADNRAEGHMYDEEKIIEIEQLVADNIGPAGSMWSSIDDMAKWMRFLLNEGIIDGDTLISAKNFKELFKPQQMVPSGAFYPTQQLTKPHWTTYGLGWFQHDYRGRMVQFHTGSLPGMVAIAGMIPDENIGVYVFGNLDHVELRHAIMYTVFDLFIDGKITRDWSADLKELYDKFKVEDKDPVKVSNTKPSLAYEKVTGLYKNDKYGLVKVSEKNAVKILAINNKVFGKLEHWHYDTYQIDFDIIWYGKTMLDFRLNAEGKISYIEVMGNRYYYIGDE